MKSWTLRIQTVREEEGFFSFMREILMSFTNRNFKKASLFREVFLRYWFEGDDVKVHMHNLHGKISKLFADHDWKEVEIINDKPDEVQAFLDGLRYYGYKEGEDWTTFNGSPVFQTLDEVREAFSQHGYWNCSLFGFVFYYSFFVLVLFFYLRNKEGFFKKWKSFREQADKNGDVKGFQLEEKEGILSLVLKSCVNVYPIFDLFRTYLHLSLQRNITVLLEDRIN